MSYSIYFKVFLIVAIVYYFFGIYFGLDFTDGFYHLQQALYPDGDKHLFPFLLSSLFIETIVGIFNGQLIVIRFINASLLLASLLLPFFLFKFEKPGATPYLYLAFTVILIAPLNANILGYDTFSVFLFSLIFVALVLFLEKTSHYILVGISILCGIAVLVRIPNVAIIPVVMLGVFLQQNNDGKLVKNWKNSLLVLVLSLATIFFGYFIYYENQGQFVMALTGSEYHSWVRLFANYLRDAWILLLYIILNIGFYVFHRLMLQKKFKHLSLVLIGVFYLNFFYFFVYNSLYSWNYSLFLTSLAVSIIGIEAFKNRQNLFAKKQIVFYLFIVILFINPLGSSTGLLKASSLFLLLPFVISYTGIELKRFWFIIFLALIPFSVLEKSSGVFEDKNFVLLNHSVNLELLKPVKTNKVRAQFLEDIETVVTQLQGNGVEVYFYGNKSHIFKYLYPESSLGISSFYQPVETLQYLPKIAEKISRHEKTALFIVDTYPENREFKEITPLEKELQNLGLRRVIKNTVVYYTY